MNPLPIFSLNWLKKKIKTKTTCKNTELFISDLAHLDAPKNTLIRFWFCENTFKGTILSVIL